MHQPELKGPSRDHSRASGQEVQTDNVLQERTLTTGLSA